VKVAVAVAATFADDQAFANAASSDATVHAPVGYTAIARVSSVALYIHRYE